MDEPLFRIRQNPKIGRIAGSIGILYLALTFGAPKEPEVRPILMVLTPVFVIAAIAAHAGTSLVVGRSCLKLGYTKIPPEKIHDVVVLDGGAVVVVVTTHKRFRIARRYYHPEDWPKVLELLAGRPLNSDEFEEEERRRPEGW
jgi:hypothetical protein